MDLKTCRKVSGILYVICLFFAIGSFVVPNEWVQMGLLGAALAVVLIVTLLRAKFWRCPKCGHILPKGRRIRCDYCKWEMDL